MDRTSRICLVGALILAAVASAAERRGAAGTGRTMNATVLARLSVEDIPGHELVQSVGIDELSTPDAIEGVSFEAAQVRTHTQADLVRGSGLVRGYGVWQAKSGEKLFMAFGYGVPPLPDDKSAAPFEGTFEWLGGTGRLKYVRGKGTLAGEISSRGEASYRWNGTYEVVQP